MSSASVCSLMVCSQAQFPSVDLSSSKSVKYTYLLLIIRFVKVGYLELFTTPSQHFFLQNVICRQYETDSVIYGLWEQQKIYFGAFILQGDPLQYFNDYLNSWPNPTKI